MIAERNAESNMQSELTISLNNNYDNYNICITEQYIHVHIYLLCNKK